MNPAHGQVYGLQIERRSTYPMEAQSIPQTFPGNYGAQNMEYQEYAGLNGGQGWPHRALDEMKDMLLLLSPDCRIMYVSPSCKSITGYVEKQLEGRSLYSFTHQDDHATFSHDLDQCVTTGSSLRLHFRFSRQSDSFCVLEAYGHPHLSSGNTSNRNGKRYDGVLLTCRPYPTRSSQLLDSFLEHKIENIRLMQQVAKLKEEEEEESNASRQQYPRSDPSSGRTPFNPQRCFIASNPSGFLGTGTSSNTSVPDLTTSTEEYASPDTITNLDEPESLPTLFPPEELSHIEGIEIMTGLYYGDGERSQGISTGTRRGRLIQCDTEVTTVDQQARNMEEGDRRKRLKGEYQCADCGTSDSPEWRKGPRGPKTLCNACGCESIFFFFSKCISENVRLTRVSSTMGQKETEHANLAVGFLNALI